MPLKLEQPRRKQLISLTPLIDVVFILLLFFMLTSSFVAWRTVDTPLAAPKPEQLAEQDKQDPLLFDLQANDGMVWFEEQAIALDDGDRIRDIVHNYPDRLFVLQAEEGVTLQSLMTLADQLKLQGAEKLSIANAFNEATP